MSVDFTRTSSQGVSGIVKVEPPPETELPAPAPAPAPPPSRPKPVAPPPPPSFAAPSVPTSTRSAWPSGSSSNDPPSPFSRKPPPHLQSSSSSVQPSVPRARSPPPPSAVLPSWSDPFKMSEEAMNAWGAPEGVSVGGFGGFGSRREGEVNLPRTEVDIALERLGKGKGREEIVVEEVAATGPGYSLLSRLGVLPSEMEPRGEDEFVMDVGEDRRSRKSSSRSGSSGGIVDPSSSSVFGSVPKSHQPYPAAFLPRPSTPPQPVGFLLPSSPRANLPPGSSIPPTTPEYVPITPPGVPPSSAYQHFHKRSNYPPPPPVATAFDDLRSRQELELERLAEQKKIREEEEKKAEMEESRRKKELEEESRRKREQKEKEERVKEELRRRAAEEEAENEQARLRLWEKRNEEKRLEDKLLKEKARLEKLASAPQAVAGPSRRTRSPPAEPTLVRGQGAYQRPPSPSKLQPSASSISSPVGPIPRSRSPPPLRWNPNPRSRSPLPPPPSLRGRLPSISPPPPPRHPLSRSRSPYRRPLSPPPPRRSPSPRFGRFPPSTRSRSPPPRSAMRSRSPPGPPPRGVYSREERYSPPPSPASLRYGSERSPPPRRRPSWSMEEERREDEDRWREEMRRRRWEDDHFGVVDAVFSDSSRAPAPRPRSRSPPPARALPSSRPPLPSSTARLARSPPPPLLRHPSPPRSRSLLLSRLAGPSTQAAPGVYEPVRSQPVASSSRRSLSPPRRPVQDPLPPSRRSRSPDLNGRGYERHGLPEESRYGLREKMGAGRSQWRDDGRRVHQNESRSPPRGPLSIPRAQKGVEPRRPHSTEPGRYQRRPSPPQAERGPSPPLREPRKPTTRPPWPNSTTCRSPTPEALLRQPIPAQHVVVTSSPRSPQYTPLPLGQTSSPSGTPPYPPTINLVDEPSPVQPLPPPPSPPLSSQSLTDRLGLPSAPKPPLLAASNIASSGSLLDRLHAGPSTTSYQPRPLRPPPPPKVRPPPPATLPVAIQPRASATQLPSNRPFQPRPPPPTIAAAQRPPPSPPLAARPGLLDRMRAEPSAPSILDRFANAATTSLLLRPTNPAPAPPPSRGPASSLAQREAVRPKQLGNLASRLSGGGTGGSPSPSTSSSVGTPPGSPRLPPPSQQQSSGLLARMHPQGGTPPVVGLQGGGGEQRSGTVDQPQPPAQHQNASTSSSSSSVPPTSKMGEGRLTSGQKKWNLKLLAAKREREAAEEAEANGSRKRQRVGGSVGGGGDEEEGEVDRFL
ncbi:hypothetical protein BDY24DRAFT_386972 [Mrakia frigida]|uniref:uncharacterized protein n=1 Tax=Mrakia frigida TaxID=29902 RepID=UPI003FCBF87D